MREVVDILKGAAKQLREAEEMQSFKTITRGLAARIYLAHGAVELAQAKLLLLEEQKEETCES